jgi:hypothetical protein
MDSVRQISFNTFHEWQIALLDCRYELLCHEPAAGPSPRTPLVQIASPLAKSFYILRRKT